MKQILCVKKSLIYAFVLMLIISCSSENDFDGSLIESTWLAESRTNDEGTINYDDDGSIRFTLNSDGTYIWLVGNTKSTATVPLKFTGVYIFSPSTKKLKLSGKAIIEVFYINQEELYTVEKLTKNKLVITSNMDIKGIGTTTFEFKKGK